MSVVELLVPARPISTPDDPGRSPLMQWIRDHLDYPHDYACLIWPFGRLRDGYGTIGRDGHNLRVHRYICQLVHGDPPTPQHQAAHSCNRGHDGCVNPRHLRWKTPAENHKEGEPHPKRKLRPEQVEEIRAVKGLELVNVTAERFGVREGTIRKIQAGKLWGADRRNEYLFTDDEVRAIRKLKPGDLSAEARRLGCSANSVWRIRALRTYRHVPDEAPSLSATEGGGNG